MSKFKKGDTVRIAKSSKYYWAGGRNNPKDTCGKVIKKELSNAFGLNIQVKWDNGETNGYKETDLELVEPKPQFKVGHGAICIKKTREHNVGDVLLVTNINNSVLLDFGGTKYYSKRDGHFTPCPNPPREHYKERIAYALGADIELKIPSGSWGELPSPSFMEGCNYRVVIPDPNAEKREQLQAEIERLQGELDSLGGDL